MSADGETFRQGMRALASGVTLVTTAHGGVRHGLTASAVCSLSADPPLLLACVNKGATAHDIIHESKAFCVNVLSDRDGALAMLFADEGRVDRRFDSGDWMTGAGGMPVLRGALASFECTLDLAVEKATHTIFVGAVEKVHTGDGDPLIYSSGAFHGLGATLKA